MDWMTDANWLWSSFIAAITLVAIGMAIKLIFSRVDYTEKNAD